MAARAPRAGGRRYPHSSSATRVVRLLTIMRPESDQLRAGTGAAHTQVNCSYSALGSDGHAGYMSLSVISAAPCVRVQSMRSAGSAATCWGWLNRPPGRTGSSSVPGTRAYPSSSSAAASPARPGPLPGWARGRGYRIRAGPAGLFWRPAGDRDRGDAAAGGRWCCCVTRRGNILGVKKRTGRRAHQDPGQASRAPGGRSGRSLSKEPLLKRLGWPPIRAGIEKRQGVCRA